jgi:hypothetical protein
MAALEEVIYAQHPGSFPLNGGGRRQICLASAIHIKPKSRSCRGVGVGDFGAQARGDIGDRRGLRERPANGVSRDPSRAAEIRSH